MTYIADLDPDNPVALAHEQAVAYWDDIMPDWEDRAAGEGARFVSEQDVFDAENGVVVGYGGNHRVYIEGAHEDPYPF